MSRTPLNACYRPTIRFKLQWPTYTDFKDSMVNLGVPTEYILEEDYNLIYGIISTSFLISNVKEKNNAIAALNLKTKYQTYLKQKELYDLELKDLTTSKSSIENKLYTVNRVKDTTLEDNFLDGGTTSNIENQKLLLEDLSSLQKRMNSLVNPYETFLTSFMRTILSSSQPTQLDIQQTGGNNGL